MELDIQQFINEAQDEAPSADRVMVPESEYPMFVKPGSTKIYTGTSDKGNLWALYTAQAVVDDPAAREATNLENPSAKISFMLDLAEGSTEDKPVLAKGTNRNTTLGALLRATGNDKQGWTYGSVEGVPFKGRVKHIADKKDATRVNAQVIAFTRS